MTVISASTSPASPSRPPRSPPERDETDQSLHAEREKADEEVGKRDDTQEDADAALLRARGRADHVLKETRERADDTLAREGASHAQRRVVRDERAQADATVRQERLSADDEVTDEREARVRALTNLFAAEREQTDERLLVERARGDAVLVARDDFMGMVAHDLRTLLGGITLSADVQVKLATGDETGRRFLDTAQKICRMAAGMNRLIGDLVDVASIEANRFSITPSVLKAEEVIGEALEAFAPAAAAKGITLAAAGVEGPGSMARGDPGRTLQVLGNLLSNAVKFTPRGGRISVRAVSVGGEVRFSVEDTGVGIPSDQAELIFERFWQVNDDRRGRGLGLFISKSIVEAQRGRIWAASEHGAGSTFFFTLPGASPADRP